MPGDETLLTQLPEETGKLLQPIIQPLQELSGMMADKLRVVRFELAVDRLEGVATKCREAGIERPREISLDVIAPWLEGASIEEDPSLHDMWESLLANAADPRDGRNSTHRSFVRILKQIEAPGIKVLEALYRIDNSQDIGEEARRFGEYPTNERITEAIVELGYEDSLSEEQLNLAKINLLRLGLCSRGSTNVPVGSGIFGGGTKPAEPQKGPKSVHISDFGRAFYEACQPPEPERSR